MPVPKKRVGHSCQGHRRSKWKAFTSALATCPNCGDLKLPHRVCISCGHYNGALVTERIVKAKGRLSY